MPDEISAHDFSRGLSESMGVNASLPQLCGALPKRLSSISPHPEYGVMSHGGGKRQREADRTLR